MVYGNGAIPGNAAGVAYGVPGGKCGGPKYIWQEPDTRNKGEKVANALQQRDRESPFYIQLKPQLLKRGSEARMAVPHMCHRAVAQAQIGGKMIGITHHSTG